MIEGVSTVSKRPAPYHYALAVKEDNFDFLLRVFNIVQLDGNVPASTHWEARPFGVAFDRSRHPPGGLSPISRYSRLGNDLSLRVANLNLAQIQLLHLFFDFPAIAD